MAVYKVPQDVEAEDKLLGPFSFKQFIFLIITVAATALAVTLFRINPFLIMLPAPFIMFFGTLALPLRKDQPMEVYLAAIISFILKPKVRLWQPDGLEKLIEVIATPVDESMFGKGYSQDEVQRRLSYLANVVDSHGWSVRHAPEPVTSMKTDFYHEAQATYDHMSEDGQVSRQIDSLLSKTNDDRRQQLINNMRSPQPTPEPTQQYRPIHTPPVSSSNYSSFPQVSTQSPAMSHGYTPMSIVTPAEPDEDISLVVNPYPTMNQSVIQPFDENQQAVHPTPIAASPVAPQEIPPQAAPAVQQPQAQPVQQITQQPEPPKPSEEPISPAIIDLANNHGGLSVETLSREAERIKKRESELKELELKESEEIFISLR